MNRNTSTNPFDDDAPPKASTPFRPSTDSNIRRSGVIGGRTNPFEDASPAAVPRSTAAPPIIYSTSSGVELHAATGGFHGTNHNNKRVSRDQSSSSGHGAGSVSGHPYNAGGGGGDLNASPSSPPIWISRNVEWPLPHTLNNSVVMACHEGTFVAGSAGNSNVDFVGASVSNNASLVNGGDGFASQGGNDASGVANDNEDAGAGAVGYISGLFSRVLPTATTTSTSASNGNNNNNNNNTSSTDVGGDWGNGGGGIGGKYKRVSLPSKNCVASSNGWVVAAVEVSLDEKTTVGKSNIVRLVSRWNVRRGSTHAEETIVPLPAPMNSTGPTCVRGVFIDPTGCHVFISAANGEAYHLHSTSKKVRKLNGFGVERSNTGGGGISRESGYVTSVAWDRDRGTEGSTKNILLGTSIGEMYQVSLSRPKNDPQTNVSGTDSTPVLLHELDCGEDKESASVSGLHFERVNGGKIFVIAVSSGIGKRTRIHRFKGKDDSLRSAFDKMEDDSETVVGASSLPSFIELPGSIDVADLRVCGDAFALRSDAGMYYGTISHDDGGSIKDSGILPYDGNDIPTSIAITPFHYISLGSDGEVVFMSRISLKVIQREMIDRSFAVGREGGELLTDIRRPEQVWLRKGRTLLHISSTMEDRDVWSLTLEKCIQSKRTEKNTVSDNLFRGFQSGYVSPEATAEEAQFDAARLTCTNTAQEAVVSTVRAEYHLAMGRAEMAAKYFAQSPSALVPFDTTALRLCLPSLGVKNAIGYRNESKDELVCSNNALITYLTEKLRVSSEANGTMACAMLGAWLTELHLNEKERSSNRNVQRQEMKLSSFLSKYARHIDASTTIRLLSSHDASAYECSDYAVASGVVGTAVNSLLCGDKGKTGALKALQVLAEAPFKNAEHFYYKYSQQLLARIPMETSNSFLARYKDGLQPTKLLPAFMSYERKRKMFKEKDYMFGDDSVIGGEMKVDMSLTTRNAFDPIGESKFTRKSASKDSDYVEDSELATLKYLEGVINLGCKSTAIYNYFVSILVNQVDEEPLFRFLSNYLHTVSLQVDGDANDSMPLDMHFALRALLKSGRHFRSTVRVYMGLKMRQQAVELALKVDPDLARELARESTEEDERKQLWLMIAKNAATEDSGGRNSVAKVLSVIKDCGSDTISIEDVLPFLPDNAQIDQFKDEICEALTAYSSKIDQYVQDMSDCDQTCEVLRQDIQRLGRLGATLRADAKCALSQKPVLNSGERFYVFPSGFVVLESVLKSEVMHYLNEKQRDRIKFINQEMKKISTEIKRSDSRDLRRREESLQAELNGLIAAECPMTGRLMVESIDRGFDL